MIFISHRGNITHPQPEQENSIEYILSALDTYDVEIDVWVIGKQYFLGHDEPQYKIDEEFLKTTKNNHRLWCHAKNIEAFQELIASNILCFYHQTDDVTPTIPNHYLWTYPGKKLTPSSVCVLPETVSLSPEHLFKLNFIGICSDEIEKYKDYYLLNFK